MLHLVLETAGLIIQALEGLWNFIRTHEETILGVLIFIAGLWIALNLAPRALQIMWSPIRSIKTKPQDVPNVKVTPTPPYQPPPNFYSKSAPIKNSERIEPARTVWPTTTRSSHKRMKAADHSSARKADFSSPQMNAILNSITRIKKRVQGARNKYGYGNSFYIQSNEYVERIFRQKIESLGEIINSINKFLYANDVNNLGCSGDEAMFRLVYKITESYLTPYGDLLEWREDVSSLKYDPKHNGVFRLLYEAPTGLIKTYEKYCLSAPNSIDQSIQSLRSGRSIIEAIPFLEKSDINADYLISKMQKMLAYSVNPTGIQKYPVDHAVAIKGEKPKEQPSHASYSSLSYLNGTGTVLDRRSQFLIANKEPGWRYLLFANEVRDKVNAAKYTSLVSSSPEIRKSYPYIQTATYATRVCLTKLSQLDDIVKELGSITEKADTLSRLDGCSDNKAVEIILQTARDYLKPYLDLHLWMQDVSQLRYSHKFDHVFSLLHDAPKNTLKGCEDFCLTLYDKVYQHIQNVKNGLSQSEASWSVRLEGINSESIRNELKRLSEEDVRNFSIANNYFDYKSEEAVTSDSHSQNEDSSAMHHQAVTLSQNDLPLPSKQPDVVSRLDISATRKLRQKYDAQKNHSMVVGKGDTYPSTANEPITIKDRDIISNTFAIPPPSYPNEPQGLQLDFKKISIIEAESNRVSGILNTIFVDDAENSEAVQLNPSQDNRSCGVWGLNQEFSDFLRLISTRPEWSRTELEELAKTHSLMLDGALEHINEAALDRYDLPLTEGDDPLSINQELIKEFTS